MTPIRTSAAAWLAWAACASTMFAGAAAADTLTVIKSGSGFGMVTSDVGAISCGAVCSHNYTNGTAIVLTATPEAGSQFTGWLGPCTGTGTCQFTIGGAPTAVATFAAPAISGRPLDIDGNADCDALTDGLLALRYLFGLSGAALFNNAVAPGAPRSEAQIAGYLANVKPALDIDGNGQADALTDGLLIIRWEFGLRGDGLVAGVTGPGAIRELAVDIEPHIDGLCQVPTFTLNAGTTGSGIGTVTSSPPGISCGADCSENFNSGTVVTLTATPGASSTFSGWGGDCAGSGPCNVTMDAARSVSAGFALDCGATCFLAPYAANGGLPPSPASARVALSTPLQKADVGFIVDTTGMMVGEITNLKNSLSSTIIPALQARIPNLGVGVAAHDDFPYSTYGSAANGDLPFYFGAAQGHVTTVTADSQTAANALTTHNGLDIPESQVPAIHHAVAGSGITWPGGAVAPAAPPAGRFGAMHFRSDALPIVVNISDAPHQNGKRALDKTGTAYDTALQNVYSFTTWSVDDVVTTLNSIGAKVIGVVSDDGARAMGPLDPYGYYAYLTDKTNSNVLPSAISHGVACSAAQCCTGMNGAGVAPDGPGGACRSVFSIGSAGTGLGPSIVNGVVAVLDSARFDIYALAYNDAAEVIDVVGNFMLKVEPDPAGGTDPVTSGTCVVFPAAQLADNFTGPKATVAAPDGVDDTIGQVNAGPLYCFNVVPKANTTVVAAAAAQTFRAWLRVLAINPAGGAFTLGPDREVLFIVPPAGN